MKKISIFACFVILLAACSSTGSNSAKVPLNNIEDSFSYAFGALIGGKMLKPKKVKEINWEIFKSAMTHSLANGDSGMIIDNEMMNQVIDRYIDQVAYSDIKKESQEFLEKKKKEGYTETASGLLYKVSKKGNGIKPNVTDSVFIFYTGSFINGKVFDSNIGGKAMKSGLNSGLIKGFIESLLLMDEGAVYDVVIPYDLAYGREAKTNPYTGEVMMEPYQTLVFNIELNKIDR